MTLFALTDGHTIRPFDEDVRKALRTLERAIDCVADVRIADRQPTSLGRDREFTKAGAMMDRLARIGEYVEKAAL